MLPNQEAKELDEAVAFFIAKDMMPFQVVESLDLSI